MWFVSVGCFLQGTRWLIYVGKQSVKSVSVESSRLHVVGTGSSNFQSYSELGLQRSEL